MFSWLEGGFFCEVGGRRVRRVGAAAVGWAWRASVGGCAGSVALCGRLLASCRVAVERIGMSRGWGSGLVGGKVVSGNGRASGPRHCEVPWRGAGSGGWSGNRAQRGMVLC